MNSCRCRCSLLAASAAVGLCCLLLASCSGTRGEAASEPSEEPNVLVRLGAFERGSIANKLPVSADLEAVERADVPAEISGVIKEVLRREGDSVKKGEPVVRLVDEDLRLAVETKRLLAEQALSQVAQADVARQESEKTASQKAILLEKAKDIYERLQRLSTEQGPGLISKEEEKSKKLDFEQAEIDVASALLQKQKCELEYQEAVNSEKLARVDLKTAEYKLSQATLRSPIDGVISYLVAKPGEMVSTTEPVFKVAQAERLQARLHVPQRELARIRAGLDVLIRCEVFPEKVFNGKIEVVNPVVDEETGTVRVIVGVSNPDGFLKPGLFVSGEIILDIREDAVLVPKKAVSYVNKEPVLFLVKDGIAHRYLVTPGYSSRDKIEVRALTAQDGTAAEPSDGTLVLVGHNNLKEGSRVEVE